MPPPAPPSRDGSGAPAGGSTVSTRGEYHLVRSAADAASERPELIGRPYGLGPRVPLTVISPWSRGGWVDSETFDHTSVIRFLEARFGVPEPNISAWRRAVCGDLTSAFDFRSPNKGLRPVLPATDEVAARAAMLAVRPAAAPPADPAAPVQARGVRRSRALGYALDVRAEAAGDCVRLVFANSGRLGAVFHVYDRRHLDRVPRRYTVGAGQSLDGAWALGEGGRCDLWVLGPDGFHRHLAGTMSDAIEATLRPDHDGTLLLDIAHHGSAPRTLTIRQLAYGDHSRTIDLAPGRSISRRQSTAASHGWYDLALTADGGFLRRFAGRLHSGRDGFSDPAMGGPALTTSNV
jgi:phospholipase C